MKLESSDKIVVVVGLILFIFSAYSLLDFSDGLQNRTGHHNLAGHTESVMGDVRLRDPERIDYVDYGADYYAVTSFFNKNNDPKNRIAIAWMNNW